MGRFRNCKDLCFECLFVCLSVCSFVRQFCFCVNIFLLIWFDFCLGFILEFFFTLNLKFVLTPFLKFVLTLNLKFDLTFIIEICFDFYSKNLAMIKEDKAMSVWLFWFKAVCALSQTDILMPIIFVLEDQEITYFDIWSLRHRSCN